MKSKKPLANGAAQDRLDDKVIPPHILSNIPLDLLAAFIDGQKPLHEIVNEMNKSTTDKATLCKRSKRHKGNKKSNKHSKSSPLSDCANSSKSKNVHKPTNRRNSDTLNTESIDEDISGSLAKVSGYTKNPCEGHELDKSSESSPPITTLLPDTDQLLDTKESANDNLSDSIDIHLAMDQGISEYQEVLPNENVPEGPTHLELSISKKYDDNSNTDSSINNDPKCHDNQPYEDGNDIRISSTDSGFHEIDSCDSNDESRAAVAKEFVNDSGQIALREELPATIQLTEETNYENEPVHEYIDLSSFRYRFINESNLILSGTGGTIEEEPMETMEQSILVNCRDQTSSPNYRHIASSSDIKQAANGQNCTGQSSMEINHVDIDCRCYGCETDYEYGLVPLESVDKSDNADNDVDNRSMGEANDAAGEEVAMSGIISGTEIDCDPFKTNYASVESVIGSPQEISRFLNYQWLKFCEKYTLHSYDSLRL